MSSKLSNHLNDSEHDSRATYSNFRQFSIQEIPPKSVSLRFPEIGPTWSYLKQVQFTIHKILFQIFQVDSLLKHPSPGPKPSSLQPFPVWKRFQSLSPVLFLPSDHVVICLYLLLKGIPRTDEFIHMKSSQNPGDQN